MADNNQNLSTSNATIVFLHVLEGLATIVLGLGMYSYFVDNAFANYPLLAEPNVAIAFMVIGAIGSTVLSLIILKLRKKRTSELTEDK